MPWGSALDKGQGPNIRSEAVNSRLTDERLELIERSARERHTLMDRVVLELVDEVRRLRAALANDPGSPPSS